MGAFRAFAAVLDAFFPADSFGDAELPLLAEDVLELDPGVAREPELRSLTAGS